jgi:hypothetical protein
VGITPHDGVPEKLFVQHALNFTVMRHDPLSGLGRQNQFPIPNFQLPASIALKPPTEPFWKVGVGSRELEVGSWKLEVGSWELEVGSWELEVGSWELSVAHRLRTQSCLEDSHAR